MLFWVSFRALTTYLLRVSVCHTTFFSPKEETRMDVRWSHQWNTECVHRCFKLGRLAGLVMVLIMHLCVEAKPRIQQPHQPVEAMDTSYSSIAVGALLEAGNLVFSPLELQSEYQGQFSFGGLWMPGRMQIVINFSGPSYLLSYLCSKRECCHFVRTKRGQI